MSCVMACWRVAFYEFWRTTAEDGSLGVLFFWSGRRVERSVLLLFVEEERERRKRCERKRKRGGNWTEDE